MKARVTTEIPFKEWKYAEAGRLGISVHSLEMRLHRGRHDYPANLQRGVKRALRVVIAQNLHLHELPV